MIANRIRIRKVKKGDIPFEVSGIFADPEVGRVLHENGLIADPVKSSTVELATITSLNTGGASTAGYFYNNKVITQFPELKYFTGLTDLLGAFRGCSNLTTIGDIPEGVTSMQYTFRDCSSLTTAPALPNTVTRLYGTFYNCSSLATAPVIPSSVTDLDYIFYNCPNIDGIYIINAVTPPTYENSLENVQAIYVPKYSVDAYKRADGWRDFSSKIYSI